MKNTSFIFYSSFYEATKCLEGSRRGAFLCKLLEYMSGGEEPVFSEKEVIEDSLFILMKPQIQANIARREGGRAGAEAGKKGGRPKKEERELDASEDTAGSFAAMSDVEISENPLSDTRGLHDKTPYPNARGLHGVTPNNNNNNNDNNNNNNNDNNNNNNNVERVAEAKPPRLAKAKRFVKPTVQEIADYCKSRNNNVDATTFFNFYESKNWYVGKNKMTDWKAAVCTWESSDRQHNTSQLENSDAQYDYNTVSSKPMPF